MQPHYVYTLIQHQLGGRLHWKLLYEVQAEEEVREPTSAKLQQSALSLLSNFL